MITYSVTDEQLKQAHEWHAALMKEMIANGQARSDAQVIGGDPDQVYYGAIGGGLSFKFTDTGLGTIVIAQEAISGKEINLTDFSDW